VLAGFRIDAEAKVHAAFMAKDKDAAEKVEKTIQAVQTLAMNSSKQFHAQLRQGPPQSVPLAAPTWLMAMESLGEKMQVRKDGTNVNLESTFDAKALRLQLPSITAARTAARRAQSMNNLKQLAIGMLNHADALKTFPPPVLYGPDGKTPYSWRVALLRFIEEGELYKQYRFDEPWDGPNNIKLLDKMPSVYRNPMDPATSHNSSYFVLVGPETIFEPQQEKNAAADAGIAPAAGAPGDAPAAKRPRGRNQGTRFAEIVDGSSHTILLVEAKRDIPWTKPEDIPYAADKPVPKLGGYFENGFIAAIADGSVRFIADNLDEKTMRLLIGKADRQPVDFPPQAR
jgi:hypothetical protein